MGFGCPTYQPAQPVHSWRFAPKSGPDPQDTMPTPWHLPGAVPAATGETPWAGRGTQGLHSMWGCQAGTEASTTSSPSYLSHFYHRGAFTGAGFDGRRIPAMKL